MFVQLFSLRIWNGLTLNETMWQSCLAVKEPQRGDSTYDRVVFNNIMTFIDNWDDFYRATEQLYLADPLKVCFQH